MLSPTCYLLHVAALVRDMRMYLLHKSLYQFLDSKQLHKSSGGIRVSMSAGHCALAHASHQQHSPTTAVAGLSPTNTPFLGSPYALRHIIAHACQACDPGLLSDVLLDVGLYEIIYQAGQCVEKVFPTM